jgi:hypothetical protein
MVLVDTSVWIRFLAGKTPYADGLDRLLANDEVLGHDLVHGELLIGDRGGRPRLVATYVLMLQAPHVPHVEVVEFVKTKKLSGIGIGWVDAHLLASCLVAGAPLWTADAALALVATRLGVVYAGAPKA